MCKSLYVDDGTFLFKSHKELKKGTNVIFNHFKRFGLTMHVGTDGTLQDSKTKAIHFLTPCEPTRHISSSLAHGYITYNSQFTYLGSIIRNDLNDTPYIENRIEQATKANKFTCRFTFRYPLGVRRFFYQYSVFLQLGFSLYLQVYLLACSGTSEYKITDECRT